MKGKWCYLAGSAGFGIWLSASFHWSTLVIAVVFLIYSLCRERLSIFLITLLTCFLFFSYASIYEKLHTTTLSPQLTTIIGEIVTIPEGDGDSIRFQLKEIRQREHVLLTYRFDSKEERKVLRKLQVGMVCKFEGELSEPSQASNFYAFDYRQYLKNQKIYWLFIPKKPQFEKCVARDKTFPALSSIRQQALAYIDKHYPQPAEGIVKALMFGWRADVERDVERLFQQFGIIHLLAISGLHVGFITALVFYFLLRIGVTRERAYLILFCSLPIYIILAGAAPSVIRAGLMTMCVMLGLRFKQQFQPIDGVSLVCLMMLLYRPSFLFEAGFQLSFVVSAALIVSSVSILSKTTSIFRQMLFVTLIAQLSALPFMLYHFHQFSLLSIPLNLLFVPFMSFIIMPLSFLSFFLHLLLPPLGAMIISFENSLLNASYELLRFFEQFEGLTFTFGRPPIWWCIIYGVSCVLFFARLELSRYWKKWVSAFTLTVLSLILLWCLPYFNPYGEVTIIDVGQGESIYIELPFRRSNLLIDTGGLVQFNNETWRKKQDEFYIGEDIVVPFLKAKGVRRIERLVLTHGDYDHAGDAVQIIHALKVDKLVVGKGAVYHDKWQQEIIREAATQKTQLVQASAGQAWREGKVSFFVLGPFGDEQNKNNQSIVLWMQLGQTSWLFTGDLEEEGEQKIIRAFPKLQADIIKVGHHGSKTSTSDQFLSSLQAKAAIISAGRDNRYGHPHPEVLQRLESKGVSIYRTDKHGAVQWKFSRKGGTFRTVFPYDTVD